MLCIPFRLYVSLHTIDIFPTTLNTVGIVESLSIFRQYFELCVVEVFLRPLLKAKFDHEKKKVIV